MAISVTTPTPQKFGFILNGTSADASACEELKAAVAGKSIIIDFLVINNGANAISITIGEGETTGAVTTALIGPISMAANTSLCFTFLQGMKLSTAKSLTVDSSGAGAICIFVQGRVE